MHFIFKSDSSGSCLKHKIDCVALKAVGESCKKPLEYYQNNITGTRILLERWCAISLRYFNLVGAPPAGKFEKIQEPNNLIPYTSQVAVGRRPSLKIFGSDHYTKHGTGVLS